MSVAATPVLRLATLRLAMLDGRIHTRLGELGLSRVMGLRATAVDDAALPRDAEGTIATGVEIG